MLDSNDLVYSVSQPGELLALVMQLILVHVIFDERIKLKLPPVVLLFERLDNFYLLFRPLALYFFLLNCVRVTGA